MHNPLVSILIPCYNHERYVRQTLDSIIADPYSNKEIVIVNDGSTDKSDEIINNWIATNRGKIDVSYYLRPNKGVCKTANELLDLANGKYVVFLASDDALYGDTLTDRVKILENDTNKLVLISDALVVDDENNIIAKSSMSQHNRGNKEKYVTDEGMMEEVIMNPSISGSVVMMNKEIFDIVGKYPEDLKAEDWYFYQKVAARRQLYFWDHPVSLYRVHLSNTSGLKTSLATQIALTQSQVKTFARTYNDFPVLKYKLLALSRLFKEILRYGKLNAKKVFHKK